MRKLMSCVLMMTLLLAGCKAGGGGDESAENLAARIRAEYLALSGWSSTVDLTAEYSEKVFEFTVDVRWEREGETVLTVTAPDLIAGITARIAEGETVLEYDGAGISLGLLDGGGLTPVTAVPALMDAILTGYMAECGCTGGEGSRQLTVVCRDPSLSPQEGTEYTLYFDVDTHALLGAEASVGGVTVLTARFSDFTAFTTETTMEMNQNGTGDDADLG